jgi:C_GCAxxG_C_C family probable redox protein
LRLTDIIKQHAAGEEPMTKEEKKEREEIEKEAFDYFHSGFCCAESVLKTIVNHHADHPDDNIPRAASAFVGGIGNTCEDVCGALTGGIIAIGCLMGRTEPGVDMQVVKELAAEYRARFIRQFGSTNCGVLLKGFGEQEGDLKCKKLTGVAAGILSELLEELN